MGVKKEIESILSSMICDDGTVSEQFEGTKLEACVVKQVENWLSVLKGNCIEEKQPHVEEFDKTARQAEYILDRMFQARIRHITRNKLIHECRGIHSTNEFDNALARLEEKKYVRIEKVATGGRPSIKIEFDETGLDAYRIALAIRLVYREMPLKKQIEIPFSTLMDWVPVVELDFSLFNHAIHFLNDCSMVLESHFEYTRDRAIDLDKSFAVFDTSIAKKGALCS